jgi:predicted membrane-bound spermidine synthase
MRYIVGTLVIALVVMLSMSLDEGRQVYAAPVVETEHRGVYKIVDLQELDRYLVLYWDGGAEWRMRDE